MVHPVTGEVIDISVTPKFMAENTYNIYDSKVHDDLYSFFSEYAHVHMIASGSYRRDDEKWYTTETDTDSLYYTIFLSLYVAWLLLNMIIIYLESRQKNIQDIVEFLDVIKLYLIIIVTKLEFGEKILPLKDNLINRLKNT